MVHLISSNFFSGELSCTTNRPGNHDVLVAVFHSDTRSAPCVLPGAISIQQFWLASQYHQSTAHYMPVMICWNQYPNCRRF
eukprot:5447138-Amphidinium_carterae.1